MGADARLRPKTRAYLAPLTKHNAISQDALLPSASQPICPCLSLPTGCLFPTSPSPYLTYNSVLFHILKLSRPKQQVGAQPPGQRKGES